MEEERTLYEYLLLFAHKKKIIAIFSFIFGAAAVVYCLFAPNIFRAESRIMSVSQGGASGATALLMSQFGSSAGIAGFNGISTNGQLFIGLLKSEIVLEKIIDKFGLMDLYELKYRVKTREYVTSDILYLTEDTKNGIVTVAVMDEDPERAAAMANAFVDELKNLLQSLAIGEAAQRRVFFEEQLLQSHKALGDAEDELQRYQEKSGLIVMEPQFQALLESIENLRAQVAAKEVEISSLQTYARGDNPSLKRAMTELSALRLELNKLERQQTQKNTDETKKSASLGDAPQLGLEYQRRLRDVKFATAMYELMMRQFEAAKIDESRDSLLVQVIHPATPPDYKYKPKRAQIILIGIFGGLFLGMTWVLGVDAMKIATVSTRERVIGSCERHA